MTFNYKNIEFDTYSAECKQFYALLISKKAKSFKALSADFDITNSLQEVLSIAYMAASEIYVRSFQ